MTNNSKIRILKIRNVKTPERASNLESGLDFFVPNDLTEVKITPSENNPFSNRVFNGNKLELNPGEGVLIPAGIKMIIEPGYDLVFDNKSGTSTKYHLIVGAKVVDSTYRGEVHLHLINASNVRQTIQLGQKVVQGIIRKVELDNPIEISEEEFLAESNTSRGSGGFGSSGEK